MRSRTRGDVALVVFLAFLLALGALRTVAPATLPSHAVPASRGPAIAGVVPSAGPEPALGGNQGRLNVTTSDPLVVPNDGLRVNLTAFAPQRIPVDSSFQAGVAETIGAYDAVFGIFENWVYAPVPFFAVFSNSTDATVHLAYWANETLVTGQSYDFALALGPGTNWTLRVNGALFGGNTSAGSYDFGASSATWAGGLSFTEIALYQNTTTAPALLTVPLTFAVHRTSGWYLPTIATASTFGTPGSAWGAEGRAQHPTLAPGEIVTGTGVAPIASGTTLWNGGVAPVNVRLLLPTGAQALAPTGVAAVVLDPSGFPLPGVAVAFADPLGGNFTPAYGLTNSTGGWSAAWEPPNVTLASSDLLTAVVTTFGYSGHSSGTVPIRPATQVLVTLSVGPSSLSPGQSSDLEFRAVDPAGAPVTGVYLTFLASAGTLSSLFEATAPDGTARISLTAPSSATTVVLTVSVSGSGVWGHLTAKIPVHAPSATGLAAYGLPVGLGTAALVLGLLMFRYRRRLFRPRPKLPPLGLPPVQRPPKGPEGGGRPPLSRTPP